MTEEDLSENSQEDSPENLQEFDEKERKDIFKRRVFILGALVFVATFFLVWNLFLNFGTLNVIGEAPFSVTVFEEKTVDCTASPCEIKLTRGDKIISIYKTGYESYGGKVEVKLWDTVDMNPKFTLIPYLKEVQAFEGTKFVPETHTYNLLFDQATSSYKLVDPLDSRQKGLSYFPEKLNNPVIFGASGSCLIIEQPGNVYFIDIGTGQRTTIGKTEAGIKIKAAKPSSNSRYYMISAEAKAEAKTESAGADAPATTETISKTTFIASGTSFVEVDGSLAFEKAWFTPMNKILFTNEAGISFYNPETHSTKLLIEKKQPKQVFITTKGRLFVEIADTQAAKATQDAPATPKTAATESLTKKFEIIY